MARVNLRGRVALLNTVGSASIALHVRAGAYYHRPAGAGHEGLWVIQLMGGGWCTTGADCAARAVTHPVVMSSSALQVWLHVPVMLQIFPVLPISNLCNPRLKPAPQPANPPQTMDSEQP